MKTEIKCLLNTDKIAEEQNNKIAEFEQDYIIQIGKNGYTYEASISRDVDGTIEEVQEYGALSVNHYDAETYIAHLINTDADEWYYLDQKLFDADTNETITHYVNVKEFIEHHTEIENDEKLTEFLETNTDKDGYMTVYITVTNNTIILGDE